MEQPTPDKRAQAAQIGPDVMVAASPHQVSTTIGDEAVILGAQAGQYFGLNEVGARVWELLQQPQRVSAICARICAEYAVEPEVCQRDVIALLEGMRDKGLLDVRAEPSSP